MTLNPPQWRTTKYIHRRGLRSEQPEANTVTIGTLYFVTDEELIERSDGAAWELYSPITGGSSGGTGNVVGPASSFNNTIVLFNGETGKIIKDSLTLLPQSSLVGVSDAQALTNKSLTSPLIHNATIQNSLIQDATLQNPTIDDFSNSNHDHTDASTGGQLNENALLLINVTTNDVSTTRHGFTPKLPDDATKFLNGLGAWTAPTFTIVPHASTHAAGGSDPVTLAQSQITGLATTLSSKADKPVPVTDGGTGVTTGLTQLNATNLTNGTVPDARLSSNVQLAPFNGGTITNDLTINKTRASLELQSGTTKSRVFQAVPDSASLAANAFYDGTNWQKDDVSKPSAFTIYRTTGQFDMFAWPAGGSFTNTFNFDLSGNFYALGGIKEYGRTVPQGTWIDIPYYSGNFTVGSGTWNVESGDVVSNNYCLIGKTLFYSIYISGSDLTVPANTITEIIINLPAGFTVAKRTNTLVYLWHAALTSRNPGLAFVYPGFTNIRINPEIFQFWGSGQVSLSFQLQIPIQ